MARPTTPAIAVDIIIELADRPGRPILLIERKYPPLGWALPGGFVDVGETLEQAARREAAEEVSLQISLEILLGCYSNPQRDTRGHTISAVYIAQAHGIPRAADDAKNVRIFSREEIPANLAFDHNQILADYQVYLNTGRVTPLRQQ